jgi:carboxyl-terminal processing protease
MKMKYYLIALVPAAVLLTTMRPDADLPAIATATTTVAAPFAAADDDLKPTLSQEKVESYITKIFAGYHYRKFTLNDSLSTAMYDNYLKEIDPSKLYLVGTDVAYFEKYRNELDDYLSSGRLDAPYEIYNTFRKRYKERSAFISKLLEKPFDYTADESLNVDREKATWSKTPEDLNDIWRKIIKNEALELKIAGKADSSITNLLKERYRLRDRNLGRIKSEQVFQMYMNSFCDVLDPHTRYFAPAESDRFKQSMFQQLDGIGALLREDGNFIKIVEVIVGGPAYKSKLVTAGDKIVGVAQGDDGKFEDIVGWYVDDAVKKIKGPRGTVVRLQLVSANALPTDAPKEIRLVREKVVLTDQRPTVETVSINQNKRDFKIGVIKLPSFYRDFEGANKREKAFNSTTRDVQKMIDSLKTQNIDGLVIDLRNNGGGSLTEAISLTGLFIPRGPVVQVKESTGEIEVYTDTDPSVGYDGPLAIMTNRFSASASEIFAGAIQDYKRGIIIGEQSYGKGTVQTMVDLNQWMPKEQEKLGQVNITIQKFYRINGSSTQRKGVTPDIELPSRFSAEKYGETSEPTALPWDQIVTSKFDLTKFVTDKQVSKLKSNYQSRLKADADLKQLVEQIDYERKARENTTVSLQEVKRKKEKEEADKKYKAIQKLDPEDEEADAVVAEVTPKPAAKKKKKKDVYLTEASRILSDYIVLAKDMKVAAK